MPINFDELPTSKPVTLIEQGRYRLRIESADMKAPKDTTKAPYLNLRLTVLNKEGKSLGSIFDIITESEAQLARYKLGRFIKALELPLTNFELRDLTKVVVGKELYGDITVQDNEQYGAKSVIDATKAEVFYSISEVEAEEANAPQFAPDDEPTPFDDDYLEPTKAGSDEY